MKRAIKLGRLSAIAICLAVSVVMFSPFAASAFDTGHHSDVTRSALQEESFGETAIKVAQLENWLVDYYSNAPTVKLEADMEKLHFDNLYSTAQIRNYWAHFTQNSKAAIQTAAKQNDPLKALILLGATLHAVQDFYTHSNWVETHPREGEAYRTDTWFSNPPNNNIDLFTGYYPEPKPPAGREPHGDYAKGLNHDSYVRPRFEEAYVFAYVASRQWAAAMRNWASEVNPQFWATVQNYSVSTKDRADLDRDLNAAYRISEWVAVSGANGHWKGNGSGSLAEFGTFSAQWIASPDSIFASNFKKKVYAPLIVNLVGNDDLRAGKQIPPVAGDVQLPTVPLAQFNERAVIVRTLKVEELPVGFFESKIDVGGKADFFAKVSLGNQTFVESVQIDRASVEPMWTTIRFVPAGSNVAVNYELVDEDGGVAGDDDVCDINPVRGKSNLEFQFNTESHENKGDVSGVHDSTANAFVSEGVKPDKDRARISFFINARPLSPSPK